MKNVSIKFNGENHAAINEAAGEPLMVMRDDGKTVFGYDDSEKIIPPGQWIYFDDFGRIHFETEKQTLSRLKKMLTSAGTLRILV